MCRQAVRVHTALLSVSLIYGFFYVAVKWLLQTYMPGEIILLRFVLTALIVLLIERIFIRTPLPTGSDLLKVIRLGLLGVFLVQILVVWGLHNTTAFHSALIMATIPILTLLFSILAGRETYHIQKVLGIITGFAGVSVLFFFSKSPDAPLPENYLWGDFIVLLNAAAFSWFLLGSQKMLEKYNSFSFMAYCYIVSAALYLGVFTFESVVTAGKIGFGFLTQMDWLSWALIAYVVLFASIGTYTLNNYALRRVTPSIVAAYVFIQPLISAVTGYYLLNEPFNMQMALATFITFLGVMLATTANHKGIYLRKNQPEATALPDESDSQEEPANVG